jgi:hypothetical protein
MITIDCSLADLLKEALERLDQGQTGETRMLITFALRALENNEDLLAAEKAMARADSFMLQHPYPQKAPLKNVEKLHSELCKALGGDHEYMPLWLPYYDQRSKKSGEEQQFLPRPDATQPVPVSHLRETVHKHISAFLSSKRPGDVFCFNDVKEYIKLALGFSYGQDTSIRSLVIRKMISRRLEHLKKERIIFSVVHGGTSYSVGFSLLSED